jgi:toxin ParE1/3/4
MAAKLVVSPHAEHELDAAVQWYENDRPGRGKKFVAKVKECFRSIRRSPRAFTVLADPYRRIVVRPFPYIIVYRYDTGPKTVTVVDVFHTSRDPDDLLRRLP